MLHPDMPLAGPFSLFIVLVAKSCLTPLTVAHQAPLSMGFPRQEYWSGLLFPSPEDLPHPGIEPKSLASLALFHIAYGERGDGFWV